MLMVATRSCGCGQEGRGWGGCGSRRVGAGAGWAMGRRGGVLLREAEGLEGRRTASHDGDGWVRSACRA